MLINAQAAKLASAQSAEANSLELQKRIADVIQKSVNQGSFKSNFYPRNQVESDLALGLLLQLGYRANAVIAQDQRDPDYIAIEWG